MAVQADSLKSIVTAIAAVGSGFRSLFGATTRLFVEPDVED